MTAEEKYAVVLLIEQALSAADAAQVRELHRELDDDPTIEVDYHVLLPVVDAAAAVEASLGVIGGADLMAPPLTADPDEVDELRQGYQKQADSALAATVAALEATGAHIGGAHAVHEAAVDALEKLVKDVDGREAIILTRPHVVAEFFHVDWASSARRRLGVPVLHLLEHESIAEQASGPGEGVTGI
ncbi:hypothetical protein [Nocardioides sp.]|uniref:hypothetical protein n=1 Tax=Nocardioides sp. TaxID=35761 RepID=UPI003511E0C5